MILIRIGPKVFLELRRLLTEDKNIKQIHEAIDIIDHIIWNFKDYSMEKISLMKLMGILEKKLLNR